MPDPTNHTESILLRFPSRLELLALVDGLASALCERLHFDEDTRSQVTTSVIEAGTNAIQHGHRRNASLPVDIEFHVLPDELEILVRDSGPGFDLKRMNGDVTTPEHLMDLRGRGIFIMRACMDRVEWSFSDTGTLCRMFKKLPPPPAPDP